MCGYPGCGPKSFSRKPDLKRHILTIHSTVPRFTCSICSMDFKRKDALSRHHRIVHDRRVFKPVKVKAARLQHSIIVRRASAETVPQSIESTNENRSIRIGPESPQSLTNAATTGQSVRGGHAISNITNRVSSSSVTHTVESGKCSTASCSSGTDVLDSIEGSSDDYDFNCASDIAAEKEQILDRLMVCVYDLFTSAGSSTYDSHAAQGIHQPEKQSIESSVNGRRQAGKKRKGSKGSGDSDPNEEENDDARKRRKGQRNANNADQKSQRMLACPYYKCNPRKSYPSNKCSGPGWNSVHRIKYSALSDNFSSLRLIPVREHLYRVHSMPLHCRRCYVTFDNEDQLEDHSRLLESCTLRTASPMEGFNKDQEKALKGRRTMFRAGSEEEKWKIVYLILFPSTAPGKLPSPCKLLLICLGREN
jgi:hypothetical protein